MEIIFTRHIKKRMRQREILEAQVRQTLQDPDEQKSSYREGYLARKKFRGKILEVIYASLNDKIILITAYWEEE